MERLFGCDSGKRALLLATRHLDLLDMAAVFADDALLDLPDDRRDYGEERRIIIGQALDGVFTVAYTMRGPVTWLVTA